MQEIWKLNGENIDLFSWQIQLASIDSHLLRTWRSQHLLKFILASFCSRRSLKVLLICPSWRTAPRRFQITRRLLTLVRPRRLKLPWRGESGGHPGRDLGLAQQAVGPQLLQPSPPWRSLPRLLHHRRARGRENHNLLPGELQDPLRGGPLPASCWRCRCRRADCLQ